MFERLAQDQTRELDVGLLARRFQAAQHGAENVREHKVVVANVGAHLSVFVFERCEAAAQWHNQSTRDAIGTAKLQDSNKSLEHGSSSLALGCDQDFRGQAPWDQMGIG